MHGFCERVRSSGSLLGGEPDFVFTSESGRPIDRHRPSRRGVTSAARNAGLGHVTSQTLRRSVATATADAKVPVVIAAAMTGHSKQVYDATTRSRSETPRSGNGCGVAPLDRVRERLG